MSKATSLRGAASQFSGYLEDRCISLSDLQPILRGWRDISFAFTKRGEKDHGTKVESSGSLPCSTLQPSGTVLPLRKTPRKLCLRVRAVQVAQPVPGSAPGEGDSPSCAAAGGSGHL